MIPYGKQDIDRSDVEAVVDVLQSDFLTQGPKVQVFEEAVSKYCGSQHGVAVNSATSALHIACLALGLGKGDYLWTSPNSFVASANCALYCGAQVDFVDIDPRTYNMSVSSLEKKLAQAQKTNTLPKIVVPVHFAGQPCDMKQIRRLSAIYGFKVLEDASHAIGGEYAGTSIGNCQYSDITVFSFHPVKIITTAEGGMAITNSDKLAAKMASLRSHGITRNPDLMKNHFEGDWYYEQISLGFNYRMTDMQAALGINQMHKLDEFIQRRHKLRQAYDSFLSNLPVIRPHQEKDSYSAFHLYPIQLELDKIGKSRRQIFDELRENDIGVNVHYIPIHMQPYYQKLGFRYGDFPNAELYYSRAVSIPLFHSMTSQQQHEVCAGLENVLT